MDRPKITDKAALAYVEHLEKRLKIYEESPYVNTYLTIKNQIDSFNKQLTITGNQVDRSYTITKRDGSSETVTSTINEGEIDLFADKDERAFDRGWKYMLESVDMNKKLDELRKLMTPQNLEELRLKEKEDSRSVAEILASNGKK